MKGKNIMKKIILLVFISLMFSNIGFAKDFKWEKTDFNISHYLKNGWTITFVNSLVVSGDGQTVYTLQRQKLIVSCKVRNFRYETCRVPVNEN